MSQAIVKRATDTTIEAFAKWGLQGEPYMQDPDGITALDGTLMTAISVLATEIMRLNAILNEHGIYP